MWQPNERYPDPAVRVLDKEFLKYRLPLQNADFLYIGGGLNFTRSSGTSDTRGNVLAGLESRRGNIHPFAEFRLTAGQGSTTQLVGGLNITLGGH